MMKSVFHSFFHLFLIISLLVLSGVGGVGQTITWVDGTDQTFYVSSGTFYDDGGPGGNYGNNVNDGACGDLVTLYPAITGMKVSVTFTSFDVEAHATCDYDNLKVFDGAGTGSLIDTYCNGNAPGTIVSTDANGALTFCFESDANTVGAGWVATITLTGDPCGGTLYDPGGPGSNYPDQISTYNYTIDPGAGKYVSLSFSSFATENNSCSSDYDWLKIYDGNSTGATLIDCYATGETTPGTITSSKTTGGDGALTYQFKSDANTTAMGWVATVTCPSQCTPPTAPTSASVDRDNFCSADPGNISLSVTGGSGENVNWYTGSCGGSLIGTGNPLVIASPTTPTTYYGRWETTGCPSSACQSVTVNTDVTPPSRDNVTVSSNCWTTDNSNTYTITAQATEAENDYGGTYGIMTIINYQGANAGSHGGYFSWHPDSYTYTEDQVVSAGGGFASKNSGYGGPDITLLSCSTYVLGGSRYVEWTVRPGATFPTLSANDISMYCTDECGNAGGWTNFDINFQSVNEAATPAAPTSNSPQCGNVTLTRAGSPPAGETWYWQGTSCGTSTGLGSGSTYNATSSGTYYIRALDACGQWSTGCASVSVTANTSSTAATSVTATVNPTTCPGDGTTLGISGGSLGTGASWEWYTGSCGGTSIGSGTTLAVNPASTTTYFVRAEGTCNTTSCQSVVVTVTNTNSTAPTAISATSSSICVGASSDLSATGGSLGSGASWEWYTGSCGGTYAGSGSLISVSPGSTTTYYLRAEGTCNTTTCQSTTITVINSEPAGTWTGYVDSDWTNANNWGQCVVPMNTTDVIIPPGCPNWPDISYAAASAEICNDLTVQANATLLAANDNELVKILGDLTVQANGTFTQTQGQVQVQGDVLVGGLWNAAAGSVEIYGVWNCIAGDFNQNGGTFYANMNGGTQTITTGSGSYFNDIVIGRNNTNAHTILMNSNVTINGSLQWRNDNKTLDVNDNTLTLAGDFDMGAGAGNDFDAGGSGTVVFSGVVQQMYSVTGTQSFNDIVINNPAGLQLSGAGMNVSGSITFTDGNIDLNGEIIDLGNSGVLVGESNGSRIEGDAGGYVSRDINLSAFGTFNDIGGLGLSISTGILGPGSTTIQRGHERPTGAGGKQGIKRYFDIDPTLNAGLNVTLTMEYFDDEFSGLTGLDDDESDFLLWRSTDGGTVWVKRPASSVNVGANTISESGIGAFSLWAISDQSDQPLGCESGAPEGASATSTSVCYGSSTMVSVDGGVLGDGASWEWYSGSCGGYYEGSGSSISVSPGETTTYFVRAEGTCNTTSCQSVEITIIDPPTAAAAGYDQNICGSTTNMTAMQPYVGTGEWSVVSGAATVTTPASPTTEITGLAAAPSTATLRWTTTYGSCTSYDDVVINVKESTGPDGSLDFCFNPPDVGKGRSANSTITTSRLQPDGKIIIAGYFSSYNGVEINRVARLLPDGSLDLTFDPGSGPDAYVKTVELLPNGKILIGGAFSNVDGTARNRIACLNPDGSLNTAFNPGSGANGTVNSLKIQSDGKILIGGSFTSYDGTGRNRVARVNPDGSLDSGFNPGSGANNAVNTLDVQSDGKIIIAGDFTSFRGFGRNRIVRINEEGTVDTGFNPGSGGNDRVNVVRVKPDGNILIGGEFTEYDGTSRNRIARLNPDGSLDMSFDPGSGFSGNVYDIEIASDNKLFVGGTFLSYDGNNIERLALLEEDGMIDGGFDSGEGPNNIVYSVSIQPNGMIIIGGGFSEYNDFRRGRVTRINTNGTLDDAFDPRMGASYSVSQLCKQPDGKIVLVGYFTKYNGVSRNRIARINADGSLDTSFDPGTGANGLVFAVATQSDGKIIIAGSFSNVNGTARTRIARLNADGTVDMSFDPGVGPDAVVYHVAAQPDGKIILSGDFTTYAGTARNWIARANSDGSLDATFNPGSGPNGRPNSISLQDDAKIILGGAFSSYDGTGRNRIVRLNSDGSIDTGFNPGSGANNTVETTVLQSDGKIVIGGGFTSYDGTAIDGMARINSDGSIDNSFNPGTAVATGGHAVMSIAALGDGKYIVGGSFNSTSGADADYLVRLQNDGTLDSGFDIGTGTEVPISNVLALDDGKVIVTGSFDSYDGTPKKYMVRIHNTIKELFWVGGDGNWYETSHWSASSGGAGGAGVPSLGTDVYFDDNSGTQPVIVTMPPGTYGCNTLNMSGTGRQTAIIGNGGLRVVE